MIEEYKLNNLIEARFAKSIRFKVVPAVVEKAVKGADAEVSVLPEKRILVPKEKISPRMNNPRTVIPLGMECYQTIVLIRFLFMDDFLIASAFCRRFLLT